LFDLTDLVDFVDLYDFEDLVDLCEEDRRGKEEGGGVGK